jgi:hypothetical protein
MSSSLLSHRPSTSRPHRPRLIHAAVYYLRYLLTSYDRYGTALWLVGGGEVKNSLVATSATCDVSQEIRDED